MENSHVLAITHTARMQNVLAANPAHRRAVEYRRQVKVYAGQWADLTDLERAAAIAGAESVHDMTVSTVAAAVAALEN